MTHDEIIAVVQAHKDGKKIEIKSKHGKIWSILTTSLWNFIDCEYRIAEPRWRDATIDDLHKCPLKCRVRNLEEEQWNDRLLEGYVCHSPKWRADSFRWRLCQVIDE